MLNITIITATPARSTPATLITRGMTQTITATLQTTSGTPVSTDAVAAWELGITEDFLGSTPLLAATNAITAAENVLSVALNGDTVEMAGYLDGKKTAQGFATLKGYDGAGETVAAYVWPCVLQNVGFDADTEAAHAVDGLFYTAAQTDAKFAAIGDAIPAATESSRGTIALATAEEAAAGVEAGKAVTPATLKPLVDAIPTDLSDLSDTAGILAGKEPAANKTQAVDAEDPSADRFPSEAALVDYVEDVIPVIPPIPADLSDLADATGILAGKVDVVAGKGLSDNNYTDADVAKVGKIELETLTELTGANVSVTPWTQSKWSASGNCTLTATGWAASGHQIAYIVITLAAAATPSISGTEEVAKDDALIAAGVYECYIKNVDGKKYFRVISFTEAAS